MKVFVKEGRYAYICPKCEARYGEVAKRGGEISVRRCDGCPPLSLSEQMARTSENDANRDRMRRRAKHKKRGTPPWLLN